VLLILALAAVALEPPRVFRLDPSALQETLRRVHAQDAALAPALARLRADAQKALESGPFSVMTKATLPPSGDKHDYMSQAPYFWPNPRTPDGLPYVRRDGERNPEIRKISDRDGLGGLISNVETLAFGFYFLGDEPYAARAALLLRTWFLDPATRMNPHLEYGQAIPGVNQGRGIGIIETSGLVRLVDAVGLLEGSKAWTAADQQGLVAWFEAYLRWLRGSRHGRDEAATTNNHGTHYDAQVASFALFTGQRSLAAAVLSESRQKRIAAQIQPDGRQPRELERTRAWSYSVMNLGGFFSLAALGERSGVDLWHYETPDGRSIRKALDWLLPFAQGQAWPYPQITPWSPKDLAPLLREAAVQYRAPRYAALAVGGIAPDDRLQMLRHDTPEGPRLGIMRRARQGGVVLTRLDPLTLTPLGTPVLIGEYHYAWSFSPDGAQLAVAISAPSAGGRSGRVGIRIVDLARMQVAIDVSTGIAAEALGWLQPTRLVAALQTGEVVVVDTATGGILHRSRLPRTLDVHLAPQPAAPAKSGLVILLESRDRRGPVHLAVADAEGGVRTVALEREDIDGRQAAPGATSARARFAVDAGGERAFVVGPRGGGAEVDLETMRVRYRQEAPAISDPETVRELPDGGWLELLR
jgi:hypothetical protein